MNIYEVPQQADQARGQDIQLAITRAQALAIHMTHVLVGDMHREFGDMTPAEFSAAVPFMNDETLVKALNYLRGVRLETMFCHMPAGVQRRVIRHVSYESMRKILTTADPGTLAVVVDVVDAASLASAINELSVTSAGAVFSYMTDATMACVAKQMSDADLARVVRGMDDAALLRLMRRLPAGWGEGMWRDAAPVNHPAP